MPKGEAFKLRTSQKHLQEKILFGRFSLNFVPDYLPDNSRCRSELVLRFRLTLTVLVILGTSR